MGGSAAPEIGELVGKKYRLLGMIGAGGMADVWRARNEVTLAEVALKTWRNGVGGRPPGAGGHERVATAERFRREAQIGAMVSHRNIVQVFDMIDEPGGALALVMELLRGESLDHLVERRGAPLSPVEAVAVMLPILQALAHVHRLGVVHRDVKPGNVRLSVGPEGDVIPKLVDFGVAKAPSAGSPLTLEGDALGTPRYMAPEQIRANGEMDGRADLFAIAVSLVELMTGASPFAAPTAAASLAAVLERHVDPAPEVPPRLWIELSRALSKRAYERHATATELADALRASCGASREELEAALLGLTPSLESAPLPGAAPAPTGIAAESRAAARKARGTWPVVAAGVLLVGAVIGTFALAQKGPARAPAIPPRAAPSADPGSLSVVSPSPAPFAPSARSTFNEQPSAAPRAPAASFDSRMAPSASPLSRPRPRPRPDRPAPSRPVATTPGF
jgi:eukaryotic-like serine/threonine-protein kinase